MYIFDFKYHTRGNNFRAKRKYKYLKINILQLFHKDSNLLIYNIAPAVLFQRFKGFMHQRCLFHCSKAAVSKVQGFTHQRCLFHSAKLQFQRFEGSRIKCILINKKDCRSSPFCLLSYDMITNLGFDRFLGSM